MAPKILHNSIFFVLTFFLIVSPLLVASSEAPFIVAHKTVTLKRLKSGVERLLVSIDIYNEGSSTAYDVSLTDDSWPENAFDVISGKTLNSWERLDVGAVLSHSFELETQVKGKFQGAPAVVKYRVPTKAALQEAFSNPIFPLDILDDRPPENKLNSVKLAGKVWFFGLGNFICVLFCVPCGKPIKWCQSKQEEALK
ncbi:uncharacterized protein LOC141643776 isoform X1 [Silene latifolia]|uniref:uncharacterized protein LOC141643776 isoform X1 n=1 Tax=Silene latifolia TaxID=37657 RepID=UPI003D78386F